MKKRFLILTITLFFVSFGLFTARQTVNSQTAQSVSLGDIIVSLRSPNGSAAQRIANLLDNVRSRGVDFPLTPEIEKILRDEGATDELIAEIRKAPFKPRAKSMPTPNISNQKSIKNSLGMEFVLIPKGSFTMGGSIYDKEYDETEGPQHTVTFNYEFYMSKYEVTQGQWQSVMDDNPSEFPECGKNCPVENISWNMAKEFVEKMNKRNDGFEYRLPSEAEWEYAARAGTTTQFYWGEDLRYSQMCEYANVPDREALKFDSDWQVAKCSDGYTTTAPVGKFKPNNFGLYDMSGNIWEWVEDIDSPNYRNLPTDGSANLTIGDRDARMLRGGSWAFRPWDSRLADRTGVEPDFKSYVTGFRLAVRKK